FAEEPCACGSPLRAVRAIHGRQDDIFDLGALVTPDILRNAVVDADRRITDFRILQTGPGEVEVELDAALAEAAPRVARALIEAIVRAGGEAVVQTRLTPAFGLPTDRKLRRVERLWRP
ncbi:hypothetical protein, partial [Brevundimonas sp.]|uniref:hypothetical protein n=1 Tax=Brevundimonas sp. TaxID=1871086 RepID=UPI0025EC5513